MKKANSKMGDGIYFKMAGKVDLGMLNMFAIKLNLYDISYSYRNIRQNFFKLF